MQCEGWRKASVFALGAPAKWVQCKSEAVKLVVVNQDGVDSLPMPACDTCLLEIKSTPEINLISEDSIVPTVVSCSAFSYHRIALSDGEIYTRVSKIDWFKAEWGECNDENMVRVIDDQKRLETLFQNFQNS